MIEELKNFVANGIESCKILVIGDVMLDKYYFGDVTRISPEAPIPIAKILEVRETLGGAANVAHNLALLGCKTSIVGQIGRDSHGEKLLEQLNDLNIDFSGVIETSHPTTTKIRVISGHQQMIRLDFEDSDDIEDSDEDLLLGAFLKKIISVDAVILSDYGKGICTEKICKEVIKLCREQKKFVVVDPKGDRWQKYINANYITPNLKEFNEILSNKIPNDDSQIEIVAKNVINDYQLDGLLVTRSAEGMSLIDNKNSFHIEARAQEVYDVSGAGDTVIAVFTLALAGKISPSAAVYLSNIAASVAVAKVGTYALNRSELLNAI